MGTLSTAFNITTGALDAEQAALAVVSNNVANANTTGYTREVASFVENDPITLGAQQWGDGTTMIGAIAERDPVLEEELQQQNQAASAADSRLTTLQQVQTIFSQSTSSSTSSSAVSGISQDLSSFFDALSSLESDPSSSALRQSVLSSADTLTGDFQSAASQLTAQQNSIDQQSVSIVQQVNALTQSIAKLNAQIQSSGANTTSSTLPNTLEDQRQQDIQQLSQLIGIHQIQGDNNDIDITTSNGTLLVAGSTANALSTGSVAGTMHVFDSQGNDITTALAAGGGQIGGLFAVRDEDIPQISSALDTLAYDFGTAVNSANEAGLDVNGTAGTAFFNLPSSASGAASQISVAITDPDLIAAAGTGEGSSGDTNLLSMAGLANQTVVDGSTPADYYSTFVSALGTMVSDANIDDSAQQASLTQLQTQVSSLSAVNLNDEAASLETFEQSYQAASKVFSVLDSVVLAALNLGEQVAYSS